MKPTQTSVPSALNPNHGFRGNWNFPTQIRFGAGRLPELPDACRELGMERPLLITDPGLAKLPLIAQAQRINEAAELPTEIFSEIQTNPIGSNVSAGVQAYRDGRHDGVIAFGGGSAIDVAKAIALMVGQVRPLWDFEDIDDNASRVDESRMAPVVAVPTTSGTGSEVGRASVIVDEIARKKRIIFHPKMLPARVICDPDVTAGLPARIAGATGIDALSHSLEAYLSPGFHPMATGVALEAIRLVYNELPQIIEGQAYAQGDGGLNGDNLSASDTNLAARARMMAASLMGATAFQKGLGAMHALAHPIGASSDAHHGTIIGIVMPYVLIAQRTAVEERLIRMARFIGLPTLAFSAVIEWICALRRNIGIPQTLSALDISRSDIKALAHEAALDPSTATSAAPIDQKGYVEILDAALEGEMAV